MFTLIENGEVYGPEPCGQSAVLLMNDRIAMVGAVDRRAVLALGVPCDVIDASGCLVTPSVDLEAVLSQGPAMALTDPHITLQQSLEAILVIELIDNEGWLALSQLATIAGEEQLTQ